MKSTPQENSSKFPLIILLGIVAYSLAFAFNYLSDPMALSPQLDAKENLVLASQFDDGTLASEPFYRAVLYPYLLSLITPVEERPLAGLFLGLACHLANALLVYLLAGRLWQKASAQAAAAALYLLNPASLFFSLQLLDVTMGTSLFLGGLLVAMAGRERPFPAVASGLILGLCILARPHFLPAALLVPAAIMLLSGWKVRLPALGWIAMALVMLAQGTINYTRSDEFRILPWQGSYNLYAANRPGANGLYYKQSIDVSGEAFLNPARAESEWLYQEATGETPPLDIGSMKTFWRKRTVESILEDPAGWMGLMAFKAYAVLNAAEQYNNLTFSFHKARFPLLRFNPMNWGVLLVLGTAGGFILFRRERRSAGFMILLVAGYAVSLLLYYASARFRLPLVPMLAILSGGVVAYPRMLAASKGTLVAAAATVVAAGTLAFSSWGSIHNRDTYVQDHLLLANAHAETGQDLEAARWAYTVLWDHPDRREAQRIYTVSYFNLQLMQDPGVKLFGNWDSQRQWIVQSPPTDPVQDVILGVFFWQWGRQDQAAVIWNSIMANGGPGANLATACLAATGRGQPVKPESANLQEAVARLLRDSHPESQN